MKQATSTPVHPLDALSAEEITACVAAVRATGRLEQAARFASVTLEDPDPGMVAAFEVGGPLVRRVRLVVVPGPGAGVVEATVDSLTGAVEAWEEVPDARPALMFEDALNAIVALHAHEGFREALAKRGIDDVAKVQIDPWPTGNFGVEAEEGHRIMRCLSYYRDDPTSNGYARPVEGLLATVDAARGEVLDVTDFGTVALPEEAGSYYPEDNEPLREGLERLDITQPDGPSFTVEGNLVRWQRWSFRVSMDPLEGLVLQRIGYEDQGRLRPVLRRASISEMVVPYGDPDPMHSWKNAFDVGEWGLGRMASSLSLGCDCLGEIRYLDAVIAGEQGEPTTIKNAICIHEEDFGILWKHRDMHGGRDEVRRSRRLVVSFVATVGNYEYAFYWYFYLDGSIQLEVKLTGIMSPKAMPPGESNRFAPPIAPGLAAPVHQHFFCARLDCEVDGPLNEVYEIDVVEEPAGAENPLGNAFSPRATLLATEKQAKRVVDPRGSRTWRIVNPKATNRLGRSVAFALVPSATSTLLAAPESSVGRRATFATKNLWVTPYAPGERRAAGDYPNQHPGGDGLPRWTAADRSLEGTRIVLWHSFGVTHVPRPEDWPVMPVECCGFKLVPVGFFDRNPALDLPPPERCHAR